MLVTQWKEQADLQHCLGNAKEALSVLQCTEIRASPTTHVGWSLKASQAQGSNALLCFCYRPASQPQKQVELLLMHFHCNVEEKKLNILIF